MAVDHPRRGALRTLVPVLAAATLLGAGFAAGRLTLTPPPTPHDVTDDKVLVPVAERTIGQTLDYGGKTSRAVRPIATNTLAGVVTAVADGQAATRKVGDVLYSVAGVPVRVVQGKIPFHRALGVGTAGGDVAQLESALVALGHLPKADSTFDDATAEAVRAWQRALGMSATGTVALGELVAAPRLPASIIVDPKTVWQGALLAGGEVVVSTGTGDPEFVLPLSPGQLNLVPADAPMTVEAFGKSWPARWESSRANDELGSGQLVILSSPTGGPVCGNECGLVPAEQSWVTVHIEVVPRTTGPSVPASAVTTDATGQAWVTMVKGGITEQRKVVVTRAHAGLAVVDGVEAGETVQALAQADSAQPGDGSPATTPSASASPSGSP